VRIDKAKVEPGQTAKVRQVAYIVPRAHKMAALGRVLDIEQPTSAIIFCRTRTEVDELTETMNARGYRCEALHGGLSQDQRDRVMKKFRANKTDLLVATDVAARGLDIQHVSHVVNYDVPTSTEAYVHRIGRTGRAGREGMAISLAEPREHRMLRNIELATKSKIEIATVPTVADLRTRRLELTKASLREGILAGDLDAFRSIVEALADEFDVMDVAAAAVKQLELRDGGSADEKEIPAVEPRRDRPASSERSGPPARNDRPERTSTRFERADRAERPRAERAERAPEKSERPARSAAPAARESERPARPARKPQWDVARLYVGAGRLARVRPGDLVGAIANELQLDASVVGAIQIQDKFSIVEVPDEIADDIIDALRNTTIKGKRVVVRRDRS
jgi:ATP-dependent RNA helicase DeaD